MKVLIVDDEQNIRDLMIKYFSTEGIEASGADNGFSAQRILRKETFDICLIDFKMPGMDGIELIQWIRTEGFRMPIIMVSAHGEIPDAVEALKNGAQDYVQKPFNPDELTIKIKSLVEAQNLKTIQEFDKKDSSFIGETSSILKIKALIDRIAPTTASVLITGESGTGKEVVARSIHDKSNVSNGPFVPINIGGVPGNLLESELFGYEKGAFTGAVNRKSGMFELANGGTLFLDEIGEMPFDLQVKLLRVLQEKNITRLGGTNSIPINARIICATNKDLEEAVKKGEFREDLFYRLNVVRIEIPPLRERTDDIPLLCYKILQNLSQSFGRKLDGFTPQAMKILKEYSYPGNIRELENIIERAAIFTDGSIISEDSLNLKVSSKDISGQNIVFDDCSTLKDIEKNAIERALRRWEGNRTKAANELGISRRTLITKIKEYDLGE